ncbi:hypothetical protein DY000_02028348 [Brassica cretica]|uniref:Uncharacterized protein n=1 Tax=Brassica cretica TaxID=69181 RepID=A0ABQ7DTZ1_BRACR|nr:hypothetical protein DY000_02028348 [Brassica cretica]
MTEPSASNSTGRKGRSPESKAGQAILRKPPMPEKGPNHGMTTPKSTRQSYLSLKDIGREKLVHMNLYSVVYLLTYVSTVKL